MRLAPKPLSTSTGFTGACAQQLHNNYRKMAMDLSSTPAQTPQGMDDPEDCDPYHELYTQEIQLYKTDIDSQRLVRIASLGGEYALFLVASTKDFLMLKADCAYIAHDCHRDIAVNTYNRKKIGVWNFTSQTLEDVDGVHPWRNWPVPIWITPSLC
ncbi:hypothetical protein U9M48_002440 [Paspalum notatum var. saurae]|uniref:DUF295 domain-containing protein n=1 Tax=Paspalum notatum var. saurae TaxID=547442 RepID=A0AAQ3PH63_PASNO